jgi:hypothetical protein
VDALEALHPLIGQRVRVTVAGTGPRPGCSFVGTLTVGSSDVPGLVVFLLGDRTDDASRTYFTVSDDATATAPMPGGVSIAQGGVRIGVRAVDSATP